jgi:hypothetical protein
MHGKLRALMSEGAFGLAKFLQTGNGRVLDFMGGLCACMSDDVFGLAEQRVSLGKCGGAVCCSVVEPLPKSYSLSA